MEPPASLDPDSVRNEKVKVLRCSAPSSARELERRTVRGQYVKGVADGSSGRRAMGRKPAAIRPRPETYVALCAHVEQLALGRGAVLPAHRQAHAEPRPPRSWSSSARCPTRSSAAADLLANRLTIRLQPEEDISLTVMNKAPDQGERRA